MDVLALPRVLLAAPSSGSGKTTVSMVLAAACLARELEVQAYKVGPDYLDPLHLARASERPAYNLDAFFLDQDALKTRLSVLGRDADLLLVEGVMGLFDGKDALGRVASSAHLAKLLGLPVILVIDASALVGSVAPLAQGFVQFDPDLDVRGVIANRVGSERHAAFLRTALEAVGIPLLGIVRRDARLEVPQRHLGLTQLHEHAVAPWVLEQAGRELALDDILAVARAAPALTLPPPSARSVRSPRVRIGVARDEAFSFYYPENLEALEDAGAILCPFSPLHDAALPEGLGGLYLGGGYPELHARELSANRSMLRAIRAFAGVIYAECGGRMLLAEGLECEGERFEMVGLVPGTAHFSRTGRVVLGYRELRAVRAVRDSPAVRQGMVVKGHEFHYATHDSGDETLFASLDGEYREGYSSARIHASYAHLYFPANPGLARRFVDSAVTALTPEEVPI